MTEVGFWGGDMASYALLIPILPLVAFAIQMFFGRRLPRGGDWVSLLAIVISFLLSFQFFFQAFTAYDPNFKVPLEPWTWLNLGITQIQVGLLIDNITTIMLLFLRRGPTLTDRV